MCVRVWDWSETSQTVSLFTRGMGLIRCLAKGAKRNTTSAFSGGVEMLALGEISAHIKPGRELNTLASWDLIETFPALRRVLACHYAGLYAAELVQRLAADHDPHPRLFDALLVALRSLRSAEDVPSAMLRLQWIALDEAGYRPVLDRLVTRSDSAAEVARSSAGPTQARDLPVTAKAYQFDPNVGGLTAADPDPRTAHPHWMLRAATALALKSLHASVETGADAPILEPATAARAARFLAAYLRHILGAEPATLPLVFPDLTAGTPERRG